MHTKTTLSQGEALVGMNMDTWAKEMIKALELQQSDNSELGKSISSLLVKLNRAIVDRQETRAVLVKRCTFKVPDECKPKEVFDWMNGTGQLTTRAQANWERDLADIFNRAMDGPGLSVLPDPHLEDMDVAANEEVGEPDIHLGDDDHEKA